MRTLNETQMQVLEAAAEPSGASPEELHHHTVASLIKQGLVSEKRGRNDKPGLVATPAGVALLRECRTSAEESAEAAAPARA